MIRRPPRSTLTDTLCPYTTLFRSLADGVQKRGVLDLVLPALQRVAFALRRHPELLEREPTGIRDDEARRRPVAPDNDVGDPRARQQPLLHGQRNISEESRVGNRGVSTFRSLWSTYN